MAFKPKAVTPKTPGSGACPHCRKPLSKKGSKYLPDASGKRYRICGACYEDWSIDAGQDSFGD